MNIIVCLFFSLNIIVCLVILNTHYCVFVILNNIIGILPFEKHMASVRKSGWDLWACENSGRGI